MGNFISRKKYMDENDLTYCILSEYEKRNASEVYDELMDKYKDRNVYLLSSRITASLINKKGAILIYYDQENENVKIVEMYD